MNLILVSDMQMLCNLAALSKGSVNIAERCTSDFERAVRRRMLCSATVRIRNAQDRFFD